MHTRTPSRNGTIGKKRSELFIKVFERKICGGHRSALDRKISYLRHTPCAPRNALRILTSSPWAWYRSAIRRRLVSDARAKTKAAANPPAVAARSAVCVLRDNEDRSRCFVDLYRECIERTMPQRCEKSANTRAGCYRRWNEDTQVMIERPPRLSSTRWFSYGVIRVCGYCGVRTKYTIMSARYPFDRRSSIRNLLNTYLKYIAHDARNFIDNSMQQEKYKIIKLLHDKRRNKIQIIVKLFKFWNICYCHKH